MGFGVWLIVWLCDVCQLSVLDVVPIRCPVVIVTVSSYQSAWACVCFIYIFAFIVGDNVFLQFVCRLAFSVVAYFDGLFYCCFDEFASERYYCGIDSALCSAIVWIVHYVSLCLYLWHMHIHMHAGTHTYTHACIYHRTNSNPVKSPRLVGQTQIGFFSEDKFKFLVSLLELDFLLGEIAIGLSSRTNSNSCSWDNVQIYFLLDNFDLQTLYTNDI